MMNASLDTDFVAPFVDILRPIIGAVAISSDFQTQIVDLLGNGRFSGQYNRTSWNLPLDAIQ
jgi:hypothetical protein